ncbi:MAG: ion channel [Ignavibacteriaceae bacterium]|jgi:hypothetical protein|nr:ion channel [Chlorobium sp.]MCW9066127.1 ion channel [Ignavibacteriaceae bacterium]MCW9096677.1 ion channel [Ignavibacteriaceae bacterium]
MLNDFFKLNTPFETFDSERFDNQLIVSKHLCNILYSPEQLTSKKITGVKFENVSFSKTTISKLTFKECLFKDCLFIGTEFDSVEFHDCVFENCNFFKSKFISVYAKPRQFRKAITDSKFSNIAIHLYQQLRENYYQGSQREFKNEAEYYFCIWKRKNDFIQAKRKNIKFYKFLPNHIVSWVYGATLGYGYKLKNLIITTCFIVVSLVLVNHLFADVLFSSPTTKSIIKTTYFTITTMATLGASGYTPNTEVGYVFVIINVLTGISIFSAAINSIFKKVIR